jgi:hypothetical protein
MEVFGIMHATKLEGSEIEIPASLELKGTNRKSPTELVLA